MGEAAIATSHFAGKGPALPLPVSEVGERRFMVGLSWGEHPPQDDWNIRIPHLRDEHGRYDVFYFFKLPFHLFRIITLSIIKLAMPSLYRRGVSDYESRKRGIVDAGRYDLDLCCYVFDAKMELKCVIGPADGNYTDASRKVYHSGDHQHGSAGTGDDEQAFVETRDLPADYAHFFFVVETDGRYSLGETPNASVRLTCSRTNTDALKKPVVVDAGKDAHGFIFCHVFRDGDGWAYRDISEYEPFNADWVKVLKHLALRA